jgi:hypothetical protein
VEALYAGVDAASAGIARRAFRYLGTVPRRVVLLPVRKYVALFGAVRGVPTDVMTVILLSRTVHRCLVQGRLEGKDEAHLSAEAMQIRSAFDEALDGMDLRLLTSALSDGLSQGRGLTSAAVAYARNNFGRGHDDSDGPDQAEAGLSPGGAVGEGAVQVDEVLRRPEIARLITEFDAHFDAVLAKS